ncbi:hypothetical protein ACRASX_06870 [Flavobacterium sp. TMP13]|uniref:hypothetical protein n=1 Tax=Flavobacterium sp. TMP13 TaxID=3425950 RepID=UPI003D77F066
MVYTDKITDVGFNTFNSENISIREYDYIDLDNSKYLFFTIEKKLKSIPWSAKLETLQSFSKRESFINSNATTFGTNQTKLDVTLLSYFKSNDFNVSLGVEYLVNSSVNDSNKEKSQLNTVAALFAFNGVVFKDKLNWDLESKIIHFDSANSKQKDVFELNPSITYSIKDWKFMLRGVNILNIRDNNTRLRVNNSDFYFEAQQYSSLAGFVTTGFSYSF